MRYLWRLALLALLLVPGIAAAAPSVTSVRIGEHLLATRLVLELSEPVGYSLFTLGSPYRFVIDLPELDWQATGDAAESLGIVKRLRVGLFRPGTSRVVFDLKKPARVRQAFMLAPDNGFAHRLVVDLEPVSAAAFRPESAGSFKVAAALPVPPRRAPPTAKPVIAIDAGHGGVDPGAIGAGGTYEKHITLAAAKELKKALDATGRYTAFLTRDRDVFIRLRDRVDLARRAGAQLFISLHADSIPGRNVRGASVYTLSETASDAEAAALAAKENKADLITGVDLSVEAPEVVDILIDLAQRETMNLSAHYATMLVDDLGRKVSLLRKTHRFAGFAVLKAPDIPSVLIELGYLSSRQEERLLKTPAYRAKLIDAILRATDRYFAFKDTFYHS